MDSDRVLGSALIGIGLVLLLGTLLDVGGEIVPGLIGLGFLAIAVVGRLTGEDWPGWWWPLIPGGILTAVGTGGLAESWDVGRYVVPALLIVIGLALLVRRPGARSADRAPSPAPPPRHATPR